MVACIRRRELHWPRPIRQLALPVRGITPETGELMKFRSKLQDVQSASPSVKDWYQGKHGGDRAALALVALVTLVDSLRRPVPRWRVDVAELLTRDDHQTIRLRR
jgi:hypothetical protein